MGLLALTWCLGYVNFGLFNLVIALVIAVAQMTFYGKLFMHIKGSSRLLHLAACVGVLWLLLMFTLTLVIISAAVGSGCRNDLVSAAGTRTISSRPEPR